MSKMLEKNIDNTNKLRDLIKKLDRDSLITLKYFLQNKSVGELLAIRELRGLYKVKDPAKTLGKLVELGLLERGLGCYNISRRVFKMLKEGST